MAPKEKETHRLKGFPGTCIQKVALEPEDRTLYDMQFYYNRERYSKKYRKVSFHAPSPLTDVRDIIDDKKTIIN